MGQSEIIEFLKGCENPVTRKHIADAMGEDPVKISHTIKVLLRWGEIDFIEHPSDIASEIAGYVLLRRTKFYFISE